MTTETEELEHRALVAKVRCAPGETEALAIAMRGPKGLPEPAADAEELADWHHQAGDVLDLLDEAGWYFTKVPEEARPHPASADQRLAALQAIPSEPLAMIDVHARWLATGELERPEAKPLARALEALDELEAAEGGDRSADAERQAYRNVVAEARYLLREL